MPRHELAREPGEHEARARVAAGAEGHAGIEAHHRGGRIRRDRVPARHDPQAAFETKRRELRLGCTHPVLVGKVARLERRQGEAGRGRGAGQQRRGIGPLGKQRVQVLARCGGLLEPHRLRTLLHQGIGECLGLRRLHFERDGEPGHYFAFCLLSCASFCSR